MFYAYADKQTAIAVSVFQRFQRTTQEGVPLISASKIKEIFHGRASLDLLTIKSRVRRAQGRRWQASLASLETGLAGCGFPKPVLISAGDILKRSVST